MATANAQDQQDGIRIPSANFITDLDEYLAGQEAEDAIKRLNSNYQIYKTVEQELLQRKARMLGKIPELKKTVEMVKTLIAKQGEEMLVDYSLSDQIFAKAKLQDVKTVKLWLGAGILLEYELEEAQSLLESNLDLAQQTLTKLTKDLELMKDNITTTEVSIARIYNWDVASRRKK